MPWITSCWANRLKCFGHCKMRCLSSRQPPISDPPPPSRCYHPLALSYKLTVQHQSTYVKPVVLNRSSQHSMCAMQDEVTNFRPQGSDLDYPGKLQQQQEKASSSSEQTPLTHQNGNTPAASVPQQNTDNQVGACVGLCFPLPAEHRQPTRCVR